MSETWLIVLAAAMICLRLLTLPRFWKLPLKNGEGWFLTTQVNPDFYRNEGAALLRRYRTWLVVPLLIDALIVAALIASGRQIYLLPEQFVALVLTTIWFNFTLIQFAIRAKTLVPAVAPQQVTAVQLSLAPRRLRDHTDWRVEVCILALTLLVLLLVAAQLNGWFSPRVDELPPASSLMQSTIWMLYLQAGLLLLKRLFVRWRMKLPLKRTEEYRRWREAWLTYHMHVLDAARLCCSVAFFSLQVYKLTKQQWSAEWIHPAAIFFLLLLALTFYCTRQYRRLSVIAQEIKPIELVKEFPPTPVSSGRFLAGGWFYLNRDDPVILGRSPKSLAINLANRGTYLWAAYLSGLVLLVLWQVIQ